jgi:1,4-alpha-glucan branching enzyme
MKAATVFPKREFVLMAPDAASVCLVGDFTRWQEHPIVMRHHRNGMWTANVRLQSGTYHYRFLVDGLWQDDSACPLHVPNPYGSQDAVRIVT